MRKNRFFKKFKLIYLVKGLIIILFLFSTYFGIDKVLDFQGINSNGEIISDWNTIKTAIFETKYLRPLLLLSIPLIGTLLNNRFGWILITSYFYQIMFAGIYKSVDSAAIELSDVLITLVFSIFVFLFVIIMNIDKIFEHYYQQPKSAKGRQNLLATTLGILILLLFEYF